MKKLLLLVVSLIGLSACVNQYDYYESDVRYTQDGDDCIYYLGESGRYFSREIDAKDADNTIIYRNTSCADLFKRNNNSKEETLSSIPKNIMPVSQFVFEPVPSCGCKKTNRYILVSDM